LRGASDVVCYVKRIDTHALNSLANRKRCNESKNLWSDPASPRGNETARNSRVRIVSFMSPEKKNIK